MDAYLTTLFDRVYVRSSLISLNSGVAAPPTPADIIDMGAASVTVDLVFDGGAANTVYSGSPINAGTA
jgi:hypothetical protein